MNKAERLRQAKLRIQVVEDDGSWFVVHMGLGKSAGPFKTKDEAEAFKRKAIKLE